MAEVRGRTLEVLDEVDLDDADDPRLRDGYVYEMLLAHEHQHNETMLQLIQMIDGYEPPERDRGPAAEPVSAGPETVALPGGDGGWGRRIAASPTTTSALGTRSCWRRSGSIERRSPMAHSPISSPTTGAEPPLYWEADGAGGWVSTIFGRREPVDGALPVIHVDHGQAEAFAAWAGKRLPTEFEWEAAASGADLARANLDQLAFGPAPAGAYGDGASDAGAVQMLGDVWEWTSSELEGYPGFEPFPYPEYSQVHFGTGLKVLRGGAWASRRNVVRPSFRNWDLPERRQIFAGFRCAEDA